MPTTQRAWSELLYYKNTEEPGFFAKPQSATLTYHIMNLFPYYACLTYDNLLASVSWIILQEIGYILSCATQNLGKNFQKLWLAVWNCQIGVAQLKIYQNYLIIILHIYPYWIGPAIGPIGTKIMKIDMVISNS